MNKLFYYISFVSLLILFSPKFSWAQGNNGIDPEALIERIIAVDSMQKLMRQDVIFDAELVEGEMKNGTFKQKERFIKKVYIKYLTDTTLFREEYLEYYKKEELQSEDDRENKAKDKEKEKRKRKARNAAYPILRPFYPEFRQLFSIEYLGVSEERIEDYVCHEFRVTANEKVDSLINGTFYIEADGFNLVKCKFTPAKLPSGAMFKLKQLSLTATYAPSNEGIWFPHQFDIVGKGKAAFFFGVNFASSEYYTNPVVNPGLSSHKFYKSGEDK